MKINEEQLSLLKKHGFMWWCKDQSTDKVSADCIKDVIPAANGFTVVYNELASALELSTAEVDSIDFPDDLENEWIRVNWVDIIDQAR